MRTSINTFYKSNNLWWSVFDIGDVGIDSVAGPYCINCQADLDFPEDVYNELDEANGKVSVKQIYSILSYDWVGDVICVNCSKQNSYKKPLNRLKEEFLVQYVTSKRSSAKKVSLEEPPTQVKVRDNDDKYFLAAKVGEKDGKRVGVVYFGEKNKDQKKSDYSQIFIDLDDQQLRFDKSNKHPKDILAKLVIEFPSSKIESVFKTK